MVDNAIISDLKLHCRTAAPPCALRHRERSLALCAKLGEPIYIIMLAPAPDRETRAQVAEEEKRDFELTTTYKGRPVRVEHNDGTVQVVKYDMVYILWSDGSQSSLKEAIAAALKAAKAREQQAQTVDAPQPLTLTPPSTPRRAKPSSPRGVDELRPPAAPRKARAPPWPDGDGGATGGDRAPARHYHSPGPFEPGGADTLKQGIGVGGDGATGLAPVPPGRPPGQGRCRLSYDDDDPPGHQQDAPLLAKALLEDRAGAEGRLQASGGLRPPTPLKDVNREPTLERKPEPTRPKLKFRRADLRVAARLFSSPSPSPPPSPAPSRGRSSSSSSETSAHNYDLNNKLLDGDVLQLFAAHAEDFNGVNLVTALHQIAKRNSRCADDPRCDWLLDVVTSRVAEFTARELAGVTLSCCVAGILQPTLADAIADVLLVQPSPDQLDEVLGSLGLSHLLAQRSVAEVVTLATGGLLNDADARENLGLDAEAAATLELALTDVSDEFLDELGPKGRSSLYPVLLYLQVEAPRSRLLCVLAKRRAELRAAYVRDDATPSRGQKDVSNALDAIKWSHRYEWCTPEGLSLDMAQPSTKTAVEFDGPTHYLKSGRPNGATAFKTRLLEALGWRVIHIPYYEWDELRTRNDKKAYLRQKLGLATPARSRTSSITSDGSSPRSGRSRAGSIISWASSSGSSLGGAWTCSACTEVNPDPSHVRCYLCNMPRS